MRQFKYIFSLAIVTTFLLIGIISCAGKPLDYYGAVEKVSTSATQLTVKEYTTGAQIILDKGNPEFNTIVDYLEQSVITRDRPRFVENNGDKVEVAIPYVLNYVLLFTLKGNSEISFDYGNEVWYITEDRIYSASIDAALFELLNGLFSE